MWHLTTFPSLSNCLNLFLSISRVFRVYEQFPATRTDKVSKTVNAPREKGNLLVRWVAVCIMLHPHIIIGRVMHKKNVIPTVRKGFRRVQ